MKNLLHKSIITVVFVASSSSVFGTKPREEFIHDKWGYMQEVFINEVNKEPRRQMLLLNSIDWLVYAATNVASIYGLYKSNKYFLDEKIVPILRSKIHNTADPLKKDTDLQTDSTMMLFQEVYNNIITKLKDPETIETLVNCTTNIEYVSATIGTIQILFILKKLNKTFYNIIKKRIHINAAYNVIKKFLDEWDKNKKVTPPMLHDDFEELHELFELCNSSKEEQGLKQRTYKTVRKVRRLIKTFYQFG